jgi:hypothetical protein
MRRVFDRQLQRPIAVLLLAVLLPELTSCIHHTSRLPPDKVQMPGTERLLGVSTVDGRDIEFDKRATQTVRNDTIFTTVHDTAVAIPVSQVQRVWVRRVDPGMSLVATIGALAVMMGLLLILKESCPFIYSWDGTGYVFDAEPYGGAVTRGLERDDYGALEHLRAQDGRYRLLLTNEVNETQYTNQIELWVVDHRPGVRVVADEFGGLHTLAAPRPPLSARDQDGRDLRAWLAATDRLVWEAPPAAPGRDQRQEIVLAFPKPRGATRARLVANAATALWGSHMIRELLALRGRDLPAWYAGIDERPAAADSLAAWTLREELYVLQLQVAEPTGWETRGLLPGGGPFIAADRVVPLDVRRVPGDTLFVRIRPPLGFWSLNSFAVDYGADDSLVVQRIAPARAQDGAGVDVRALLADRDDRYYAMPNTGDRAALEFVAPRTPAAGMERTVFVHARGYYRLHLDATGAPDSVTLRDLATVPDGAARFSAERFAAWRLAGRTAP